MSNQRNRNFEAVPAITFWGIEIEKNYFFLGNDKEALSAAFEAGTGDNKNLLFGSSGIVSRTHDHWKDLLKDAFKLIDSLRTELFKSREETEKSLDETEKAPGEKEQAETDCGLRQTEVETGRDQVESCAKGANEMAKAQRDHAWRGAFDSAASRQVL